MDDLLAPPENDWHPVSPALAGLRRALLLAAVGLALLASLGLVLLLGWPPAWVTVLVVLVLLGSVAIGWPMIGRSVRGWGYAERDEDLYVKHGVMFRRLVVVPYGRMQYVDVRMGPLEQAFKVAEVRLHTASPGTNAHIPGLEPDEAARLRDRLTSLGEAQAAGL